MAFYHSPLVGLEVKVRLKSYLTACLGAKPPSGAQDQIFINVRQLCVC
jgi:hypothetical protein